METDKKSPVPLSGTLLEMLSEHSAAHPEAVYLHVSTGYDNYCGSRVAVAVEDCNARLIFLHAAVPTDDLEPVDIYIGAEGASVAAIDRSLDRYGYSLLDVIYNRHGAEYNDDEDDTFRDRANNLLRLLDV